MTRNSFLSDGCHSFRKAVERMTDLAVQITVILNSKGRDGGRGRERKGKKKGEDCEDRVCREDEWCELTRSRLHSSSSVPRRLTVFVSRAREYCRNAREPTSNGAGRIPTAGKVPAHWRDDGHLVDSCPLPGRDAHPATPTTRTTSLEIRARADWG